MRPLEILVKTIVFSFSVHWLNWSKFIHHNWWILGIFPLAFEKWYTFEKTQELSIAAWRFIGFGSHFYLPQTKFAKVMFLHLSVSHSVHGVVGYLPQCMLGYTPRSRHPPPKSRHHPPSEQCMLGDTGNKRAVRILLECILLVFNFSEFTLLVQTETQPTMNSPLFLVAIIDLIKCLVC